MLSIDDWSLIASDTKRLNDDESEFPLINLGRRFTSPYQIIKIETIDKHETWDYGGQIYAVSLVQGRFTFTDDFRLTLNQQNLVKFTPSFEGKYHLFYKPPHWFTKFTIKVYEYTGEINEPIKEQLDRIEAKIDQLL